MTMRREQERWRTKHAGSSKGIVSQSAPQATTSYKAKSRSGGTKLYSSLILFCVANYWVCPQIIIALRLFIGLCVLELFLYINGTI